MKSVVILILGTFFCLGCARVQVEAPKEPIKMDISMRLDIYQHVQKDIDEIENIVSGSKPQSFLSCFLKDAYAADSISPEVEQAALSRRGRLSVLSVKESSGIVGENKSGFVEIRMPQSSDAATQEMVNTENADRKTIFESVAQKNGTSVEEVQKIYAKKMQENAPAGTPIEVLNEATGKYEWKIK
jgi:uncharacterized protein YdbL (DUF1318 family)